MRKHESEVDTKPTCDNINTFNRNKTKDTRSQLCGYSNQVKEIKDLVEANTFERSLIETREHNRLHFAFGTLLRLLIPFANRVVKSWRGIRDVRILRAIKSIRATKYRLSSMLACAANTISMSLSTVQVSQKINPLLKLIKLRRRECINDKPLTFETTPRPISIEKPNCVNIKILAEPPAGTAIRADIIFIHGLHGSLVKTWKQGIWSSDRAPVKFERPPQQPIRPPKRPRYSRGDVFLPAYKEKRQRLSLQENEDFVDYFDDMSTTWNDNELPTFRSRVHMDKEFSLSSPPVAPHSQCDKDNKSSEYSKCWPGDWLPLDCPGVRVIALNYTTDPYLWRPFWKKKEHRSNIIDRSREMAELLIHQRVGVNHPIVWVGHSKGGLFIKQILVDAWQMGRPETAPLWRSARGVFFYSVPHRGSQLASINAPLLRRSVELTEIERNCRYVLDLHRRFSGLYHLGHFKIEVFSFIETALTLMSVLYLRIVAIDSADPGFGQVCGLQLDHREICKPRSRNCILYKELVCLINKVCK